ncbi:M20/M25/M40 family metallo-hydrolase [candidate division WOR-3 bacterium]|nr:M20/M25/M40 family metallo-hydrolase [candidate division WOR-3 bacterium]
MELLKRLCDAPGVCGHEEAVREILINAVGPYADSVHTDHLGNLYMTKGQEKQGPHLMFAAHTDEVGLMVRGIDEEGSIRFIELGGIDPRVLPAKRVRIGKDAICGVIGIKPFHLSDKEERKEVTPLSDLRVDIGASSKDQVERFVDVGDPIWFDTSFEQWGDILKAKAFDDRAGCYMMTELIRHEFRFPVTFVWTVQEEVGLRGARIAVARVRPDIILVLEGTGAGDVPTDKDVARMPFLGKGPVVTILDRTVVCNQRLVEFLTDAADREHIPWQFKRPLVGGTDAGAAVRVKPLHAAVLAIPARYIHSPVALADLKDIINTIELVKAACGRFGEVKL